MKAESRVVLDCSFIVPLFFNDEEAGPVEQLLDAAFANELELCAPVLWLYEVHNVLLSALKRKRIDRSALKEATEVIGHLPVVQTHLSTQDNLEVLNLASLYDLSFYDSAYLYLAVSKGAKLATLDKKLQVAAGECGVVTIISS